MVIQLYFFIKEEGKRENSKVGKCHKKHRKGVPSTMGPASAHRAAGKICAGCDTRPAGEAGQQQHRQQRLQHFVDFAAASVSAWALLHGGV